MRRLFLLATVLAPLAACSISEEAFPEAYSSALCSRSAQCDADSFDELYDSVEDCTDLLAPVMEAALDVGDLVGGDYNPAKGGECVAEIRSAPCDDLSTDELACDVYGD